MKGSYWPQLAAYAVLIDPHYVGFDCGLSPAWSDTFYEALAHERAILMRDMQVTLEENLMRPDHLNSDCAAGARTEPNMPLVTPIYGPQPPPPVTGITITLTLAEALDLRTLLSQAWFKSGGLNVIGTRLLQDLRGRL